jgi:hypothetical protein
MTIAEIEKRLEELRTEYKTAPSDRKKTLVLMARALQIAKEKIEKKT